MAEKSGKKKQKITAKQREERLKAAEERELRAQKKAEAAEKRKRVFTIVVCLILVLALGIPTMALTVLSL